MVNYNHQKEVRPDPIRKLEKQLFTCHRKGMVETMKKIIEKINEFCSEYYKSFAERI